LLTHLGHTSTARTAGDSRLFQNNAVFRYHVLGSNLERAWGKQRGTTGMVKPVDKKSSNGVTAARQRLVLCRLMIEIMRSLHGAYAPASEPFGSRLETFFIALCIALGQFEDKPFSVTKIAAYMRVPRTTVQRRLDRLESWGLIHRQKRRYYIDGLTLNSLIGMRSYQRIRRMLGKAAEEMTILDSLPG
jgi:biotin operon repressor